MNKNVKIALGVVAAVVVVGESLARQAKLSKFMEQQTQVNKVLVNYIDMRVNQEIENEFVNIVEHYDD